MRRRSLAVLFALAACRVVPTVSFSPTNPPPHPTPPRAPESVEVFTDAPPTRPYVATGVMEVREREEDEGTDALLRTLREVAGEHGCDGAIVTGSADQKTRSAAAWASPHSMETAFTLHGVRATCIVYR